MSNSTSPQVKFVHEWFQVLQTRDLDRVANFLHKDYRNTLYPRSLGTPEQTKEEWLEHAAERYKLWTSWEVNVHSITDAPGKVIIHASVPAKTLAGVEIIRESIFIKHIVTDEDGSLKIKAAEEFTDSKAYLDAIQAVAAAKAKGQQ